MASRVDLADVLRGIESSNKEKSGLLKDLRHIIRHLSNENALDSLSSSVLQHVFATLTNAITTDHTAYLNSKTSKTRTSISTRLSDSTSTLRYVIGVVLHKIRTKLLKFLIDHVLILLIGDDVDNVLILGSAKCLHVLLSYQPHVEHLSPETWQNVVSVCLGQLNQCISGRDRFTDTSTSGRSASQLGDTSGPKRRSADSQIAGQIITSLRYLVAATNCHISSSASALLATTLRYLQNDNTTSAVYEDAFATLYRVVSWASTEDVKLIQVHLATFLSVIRKHWTQKRSGLKDELLKLITALQIFLEAETYRQSEPLTFELKALYDALYLDYTRKAERDQLQLQDVRVSILKGRARPENSVGGQLISLRSNRPEAERNWVLCTALASWANLLSISVYERDDGQDVDDLEQNGSRKRMRHTNEIDKIINNITDETSIPARTIAGQVLAFYTQKYVLNKQQQMAACQAALQCCSDENSDSLFWILVVVSHILGHSESTSTSGLNVLTAIWHVTVRLMTNSSTCRAACMLLGVVQRYKALPQHITIELIEQLASSLDLNGPASLSDASLQLLTQSLLIAKHTCRKHVTSLAQRIAAWLQRRWTPSRSDYRSYMASQEVFELVDMLDLTAVVVSRSLVSIGSVTMFEWTTTAISILQVNSRCHMSSYLMSVSSSELQSSTEFGEDVLAAYKVDSSISSLAAQASIIHMLTTEIEQLGRLFRETFEGQPSSLTKEVCEFYCDACFFAVVVAHDYHLDDTRSIDRLQSWCDALLRQIVSCLLKKSCTQAVIDGMIRSASKVLCTIDSPHSLVPSFHRTSAKVIAKAVIQIVESLQHSGLVAIGQDTHDISMYEDSQDGISIQFPGHADHLDVISSNVSPSTMRSTTSLYAVVIEVLGRASMNEFSPACIDEVTDHVLKQEPSNFALMLQCIARDLMSSITLQQSDICKILERIADLLPLYTFNRSELTLSSIVSFMINTVTVWTDKKDRELYDLGNQVYGWLTQTILAANVVSPVVQQRISDLLLSICRYNEEYKSDDARYSARTTLFLLLKTGPISVKFHLAPRLAAMFRLYTLSTHDQIFDDLQKNLPVETTWLEGIAVRLYILAELGSAWHSLLRQCIYYIFETAGQITSATPYAKHCIGRLTQSLKLDSARQLFNLFSSQLLHTWLEDRQIADLPYTIFDFSTMEDFYKHNIQEIVAQLIIRNRSEELQLLSDNITLPIDKLIEQSFDRVFAYSLGCDIMDVTGNSRIEGCEARVRVLLGKDRTKQLIRDNHGSIIGRILLASHREDIEDKWLEKREVYSQAANALSEMKRYSESSIALPSSQQPHFKSKYLIDQFERLGRRLGHQTTAPLWTSSSYTVAAQMLFDSINVALGSTHTCAVLQTLRILIALSGDVAVRGYPLEMTLRLLMTFVSEPYCADDAIGMVHYLLGHGLGWLTENWTCIWGLAIQLILRIARNDIELQKASTQTSQQRDTAERMRKLRYWLLNYLDNIKTALPASLKADGDLILDALVRCSLPGNTRSGSAESSLLLYFLKQYESTTGLLLMADIEKAVISLTQDFVLPSILEEDCLADPKEAISYAKSLWKVSNLVNIDDKLILWAAIVSGRAFAATGSAPITEYNHSTTESLTNREITSPRCSQTAIAERLSQLCYSEDVDAVSTALSTIRACIRSLRGPEDMLSFQKLFSNTIFDAVYEASSDYSKFSTVRATNASSELHSHLAINASYAYHDWSSKVATSICMSSQVLFLAGLPTLFRNNAQVSDQLLPAVIHLVLLQQNHESQVLRQALSLSIASHFAIEDSNLVPMQQRLLALILYLRDQPFPGESTQLDRTQWIECDLSVAARCASTCGMPHTALMLAELSRADDASRKNRRSSASRPKVIAEDMLLSIFQQISEPDSYYGVSRSASLDTFLQKSRYEGDATHSLVAKSAQLSSRLLNGHQLMDTDREDLMQSISALNLDSLTLALTQNGASNASAPPDVLFDTARVLQQWDLSHIEARTSSSALYQTMYCLSHATENATCIAVLQGLILEHTKQGISANKLSSGWFSALSAMTETLCVVTNPRMVNEATIYDLDSTLNSWMDLGELDTVMTVVRNRSTVLGTLLENTNLLRGLGLTSEVVTAAQIKGLAMLSHLARIHGRVELGMTASWQLQDAMNDSINPVLRNVAQQEIATVLWCVGETSASVRLLKEMVSTGDVVRDVDSIGKAGILSQIGQQMAIARLEKPTEILDKYLKPSIEQLHESVGNEAGEVYFIFASFCDSQLQDTGASADMQRLTKLRQAKLTEVEQLSLLVNSKNKSETEKKALKRDLTRAKQWFEIDNQEYQRAKKNNELFAEESLRNYMLALRASDKHDICILRFFALWLEHNETSHIVSSVQKDITMIPTWKFVVLMNQLMSRLKDNKSTFDQTLYNLLLAICAAHPYHAVHHVYAARKFPGKDEASEQRRSTAQLLADTLIRTKPNGGIIGRMLTIDSLYRKLAEESNEQKAGGKLELKDLPTALKASTYVPRQQIPAATMEIKLQPDAVYKNVPIVTGFANTILIMSGISAPKVLTTISSDGTQQRQLFKGGNDDLRQDAIMEQVFGEVSKMLKNHKASRRRDLHVRTYKVIPLSNRSGIIEFVANSMPLNDFLQPAHIKYHPSSWKASQARQKINAVADHSTKVRVKEFKQVCDHIPPVLRHFFFERFRDPDKWFECRTAYTRTTATISILGQIIGLGDRHCHNILLDEKNGEVIHIDLGVAFEAGRVLPIPELVPFRLTRDIVDAMGVTGTEGIFRRCAEFTLEALRKDKDGIMTLLNVLRYDPLYSWTLSPIRAKRMQQQEDDSNVTNGTGITTSSKDTDEAGEADRALSIVERKLGNALSTAAVVSELIQQATDETNLATLFNGWAAFY